MKANLLYDRCNTDLNREKIGLKLCNEYSDDYGNIEKA